MSKRKVDPLEGGDLPPEKKQKTSTYADEITIRYEPDTVDKSEWLKFPASYFALKMKCKNPFFDGNKIPAEDMVIKSCFEYGAVSNFLRYALDCPLGEMEFFISDGYCSHYEQKGKRFVKHATTPARVALGALPVARFFEHDELVERLTTMVIRAASETDIYNQVPILWDNRPNYPTCAEALLDLAQKLARGKEHAKLIVALLKSKEVHKLIRDPSKSDRFAKVFRQLQMADRTFAAPGVRGWLCPQCGTPKDLWTDEEYVEEILGAATEGRIIDWDARFKEKIAAIKTCRDHDRIQT